MQAMSEGYAGTLADLMTMALTLSGMPVEEEENEGCEGCEEGEEVGTYEKAIGFE